MARHTAVAAVVLLGGVVIAAVLRRTRTVLLVAVVIAGLASGHLAAARDRPPPPLDQPGSVVLLGVVVGDPAANGDGWRLVVEPTVRRSDQGWEPWAAPRVAVIGEPPFVAAGEPVLVAGTMAAAQFRTRHGWVAAVVQADRIERLGEAANPMLRLGNRLRTRVLGGLHGVASTAEGALVSGFLIGEVSRLPEADAEALRAAGLSHYVAVSGSNVGLFLGAWWLAAGPLAWRPRRRALVGLIGLMLFVVATRWEPSVLRAALMAALVLGGRLVGRTVTPWEALGWSVALLVVADGSLALRPGFQLSVAATAGILAGIPVWPQRRPRWVWATLGATVLAQVAVAPLLLAHFGTVPLLAPLTNLIAAPLVVTATALGGIGALLGADRLVHLATLPASVVLHLARGAADLPQLGVAAMVLVGALGLLGVVLRGLRPVLAMATVVVVAVAVIPAGPPDGPEVWFLDVGQGDAALVRGPGGEVVLIDGGPDPVVLRSHLRRAGVRRIDLLVISHRHADHTTGLVGLHVPVGRVWHPPQLGDGPPFDAVIAEQSASGAIVEVPVAGTVATVGSLTLEVLAPRRIYASPNDGSLVVRLVAGGIDVLFSGDVEAIAQADLGPLPATVLKVPHQGAATSDLDWITASAPAIAVISVGPNDFGHPSPEVVAALQATGAVVYRTDHHGTVRLRLDRLALPSPR